MLYLGRKDELPTIYYRYNMPFLSQRQWLGCYDRENNVIYLRMIGHGTIERFCGSFIHEWVHYLQRSSWYTRYENNYTYRNNPYEVEAYLVSLLHLPDFFIWLQRKNPKLFTKIGIPKNVYSEIRTSIQLENE